MDDFNNNLYFCVIGSPFIAIAWKRVTSTLKMSSHRNNMRASKYFLDDLFLEVPPRIHEAVF